MNGGGVGCELVHVYYNFIPFKRKSMPGIREVATETGWRGRDRPTQVGCLPCQSLGFPGLTLARASPAPLEPVPCSPHPGGRLGGAALAVWVCSSSLCLTVSPALGQWTADRG